MRILIIGAGAIGSLLGARLALAGHDVTLAGRPALVAAVQATGLILLEPTGASRRAANVRAVDSIAAAFTLGMDKPGFSEKPPLPASYDLALLTVKAYDTAAVIAELRALDADRLPPLLTLQNGVGNEEALAAAFGADRIVAGAIDTPASIPAPGQVQVHRDRFRAGLAPVGKAAPLGQAAALLRDAGFKTQVFDDYRGLKWAKLLMNLLANAQCAILDWTPAQVMAHPVAARLEALAWQEALAVMARLDIRPVALAGYPLPLLAPIARRLPPTWLARGLSRLVTGGRGGKMPSLHIALAGGKRSEVTWLNGAVARFGHETGVPTPVNAAFADVLVALTEGQTDRDIYRGRPEKLAGPTGT